MVKRIFSADSSIKPTQYKAFRLAEKRQTGLRVRIEFAEALKVQSIRTQKTAELILDEILAEHFNQTFENKCFFKKAQQIMAIKQID